ncbi:MAG: phosphate acyltransferase [Eubacterium sp.]|jgi:phosphate butyryltransferase
MFIKNFNQMREMVSSGKKRTVAVVCAHDEHALEAVLQAHSEGLLDYVLIGKKDIIIEKGHMHKTDIPEDKIIDCDDDIKCARIAIQMVKDGDVDFIQKGLIKTATLLREVVHPNTGLNVGRTISHLALLDTAKYHKIIGVTDGGIIIQPTLDQKKDIISNAVNAFLNLGYDKPKVACLCAIEYVNPKMPETVDAEKLANMATTGEIPDCYIAGPISMDLACNSESATIKGYRHPVAGDVDILLVPDITAGNIVVKAMTGFSNTLFAGCVLGAKCPIALNSRSSTFEEKYYGLIACSLMVDRENEEEL